MALELARHFGGGIIAADSRTVYRGMDIGTAKPTAREQQEIPHYGLDIVNPGQPFSAYDFKLLAERAIGDIAAQGRLPIVVGGTGLYIDSLLYNFSFRPQPEPDVRSAVAGLSIEQLQKRVQAVGLPLPANSQNRRHLTRLLESGAAPAQQRILRPHTLVLGLRPPREILRERIAQRVASMLAAGLVDEVRVLRAQYGDAPEAFRAPGYKAFLAYLRGEISLDEARQRFVRADLALAKRQRTWFRRNKSIHWLQGSDVVSTAVGLVEALLHN